MLEDAGLQAYATLEVEPDADERTLRRAYARKLKALDPAREPEKFQELRQAYEWALQRAQAPTVFATDANGLVPPAPELGTHADAAWRTAPPQALSPESAATDAMERSTALAQAVLDDVLAGAAGFTSEAQARERLRTALAHEALRDLEARLLFESGVTAVLANGWQPGHEHLFTAAIDVFGWREQRAALDGLGHAAAVIDQAIEELETLEAQPWKARAAQQELIRLLRQPGAPDTRQLLQFSDLLERLERLYPHLLGVITCTSHIGRWQQLHQQIPRWRRLIAPRSTALPQAPQQGRWTLDVSFLRTRAVPLAGLLSALTAIAILTARVSGTGDRPPQPAAQQPRSSDAAGLLREPFETPAPPAVLQYPAQARAEGLQGSVTVYALIGPDGNAMSASVAQSSGHGILDQAALDFVNKKRFPAPVGQDGQPIIKAVRIPVRFVLEDGQHP